MKFQVTSSSGRDVTLHSLIGVALFLTACFCIGAGIRFNGSPSEQIGYYLVTHRTLARDRLVFLKSPLKHIAGLPGDTVRLDAKGCWLLPADPTSKAQGTLLPNSAPDPRFPHYPFGTYKLGSQQFWMLGNHPLSWDSRYFGPVPKSLIYSTADRLFTWSTQ
jgi:type IV secretory pathway protease TraF